LVLTQFLRRHQRTGCSHAQNRVNRAGFSVKQAAEGRAYFRDRQVCEAMLLKLTTQPTHNAFAGNDSSIISNFLFLLYEIIDFFLMNVPNVIVSQPLKRKLSEKCSCS
jgi:hypothetical protein